MNFPCAIVIFGAVGAVFAGDPLRQARSALASSINASHLAIQVEAENLLNYDQVSLTPGGDPYQNKIVILEPSVDGVTGAPIIKPSVRPDPSPFKLVYDPHHPAADPATGLVKKPNVERPIAQANVNEATIQAAAAAQMIENTNKMEASMIDLLRSG